jgi:AAA+ superfamily predicted ATPase
MFDRLDWQPFPEAAAREAFAQLAGAPAETLAPFDVKGVVGRLPFYRAWRVIRLDATHRDSDTALEPVYALWRNGREPLLLEGDAAPVHTVNEDESLALKELRIADYIRWFLSVLRVDEQAFILFEQAPLKVADDDKAAAAHARPLTAKGRADDGAYLYDAVVIYLGALFSATFSVPPNGEITMIDDNPLMADFPATLTPDVPWLGLGFLLRAHIAAAGAPGGTGGGTAAGTGGGAAGTAPRTGAHRDQPPGRPPGRARRSRGLFEKSGAARVVDLGGANVDPTTGRVVMTPMRGGKPGAGPARPRRGKAAGGRVASVRSGRPVILELVELLLERALEAQSRNRLLGHFNASLPTSRPLRQFAAMVSSSSPVVIVESSIPFVEEPIGEIVNGHLPPRKRLGIHRAAVGVDQSGSEALTDYYLPSEGPGLVLIPFQVYGRAMQVERLAYDLVARDLAAIITCTRFGDLPESLRRHTDLVLRLPTVDAATFETLFERIFGEPPKRGWRRDGNRWVKYLLHTDFEHPRRMRLDRDQALEFIRSQVLDRLRVIDPGRGLGLKDLHGLGEARQFAEDLIADIHSAMAGRLDWSQVDRGALLVGEPGTGKTTLARAIAKDCGVRFIQGSAATWMVQGVSLGPHIAAIRKTFTEARDYAPSILFIDEIDSLGSREQFSGDHNSVYQTDVINAVLEQMQGLDPSAPVFVVAATNHEERVDPALRRSGRLDRVIRIPRPNSVALDQIFRHYLGELDDGLVIGPDVETGALGQLSVGLTGADVERMVRGAARRARRAGRALAQTDVIAEIMNKPRWGEGSPRLTPADLERTSVHEAGHALAAFLSSTKGTDIGYVTVVPRDDGTLGFVAPIADLRVHFTRRDYEDKLDVYLAGRAAEELRYGADEVSSGSASDLQAATELATRMVTRLGLGGNGRLLWTETVSPEHLDVASAALSASYERVLATLKRNRPRLDALVGELVVHQELRGDEVRKILRRRPKPARGRPQRKKTPEAAP